MGESDGKTLAQGHRQRPGRDHDAPIDGDENHFRPIHGDENPLRPIHGDEKGCDTIENPAIDR